MAISKGTFAAKLLGALQVAAWPRRCATCQSTSRSITTRGGFKSPVHEPLRRLRMLARALDYSGQKELLVKRKDEDIFVATFSIFEHESPAGIPTAFGRKG